MKQTLDKNHLWNEAAKGGALLGLLSVACLSLKEVLTLTGNTFLMTAAGILLWAVEFFGCILLMKKIMLDLRDKYEDVRMEHTKRLGQRAALLSGLLLASAQTLFILNMPQQEFTEAMAQAMQGVKLTAQQRENMMDIMDKLPLWTFIFQWFYCWLYGTILAAILSRYIFVKKLFDGEYDNSENKIDQQ